MPKLKLTPQLIEALSEYIRKGNYAVTACNLVGIDDSTFYRWLQIAQADIALERESIYRDLYDSLKRAESESIDEMLKVARGAAKKKADGYLAITVLERRHPDLFGRRERKTIDISERKVIEVTHVEVIKDTGEGRVITAKEELKELTEGSKDDET